MKPYKSLLILIRVFALFLTGCEKYLNIPPEADISEEEIFGTYETFQGFQDRLAVYLADYNRHGERRCHSIGGEAIAPAANQAVNAGNIGDYWRLMRSEEHTSELQSLMRISYAVFCLKKKKTTTKTL